MSKLNYNTYNHLIYLYFKDEDYYVERFLTELENRYHDESIELHFIDFVKSQLNYKIIKTDYKYLIAGSVFIIKSFQEESMQQLDPAIIQGLKILLTDFVKIFSIVGIYLYTKSNTMITFNLEDSLQGSWDFSELSYDSSSSYPISEIEILNLTDKFPCLESLKNEINTGNSYVAWLCNLYKNFRI